jgi:hypothetical protein
MNAGSPGSGVLLFGSGAPGRRGRRGPRRRGKATPIVDRPSLDLDLYERLCRESELEPKSVREAYAEEAVRVLCAMRELSNRQRSDPRGLTGDEHRAMASYGSILRKTLDTLGVGATGKAKGKSEDDEHNFGEEDKTR